MIAMGIWMKNIINMCQTLNSLEGIRTIFSCSGHPESNNFDGYVVFVSNNEKNLKYILSRVPSFNFSEWGTIRTSAGLCQNHISYGIDFTGTTSNNLKYLRDKITENIKDPNLCPAFWASKFDTKISKQESKL